LSGESRERLIEVLVDQLEGEREPQPEGLRERLLESGLAGPGWSAFSRRSAIRRSRR
jgi:hypothetical protein